MPRTKIQSIVDAAKVASLGEPITSEKAFDKVSPEYPQRFRRIPGSNLIVDLDTGVVYLDQAMLKVLQ